MRELLQRAGRAGWSNKFARFLVVGVLATGVQYIVLFIGVEAFGAAPERASGLGFALSAFFNYLLNRQFTFRSNVSHFTGMLRFSLVVAVGLCLNFLFMFILTGYIGWHYLVAQLLTTGIVMLWNFVGNALWTFAER